MNYRFRIKGASDSLIGEFALNNAGLEAARRDAIAGIREIYAGDIKLGRFEPGILIEIVDRGGQVVETVGFADAVQAAG